MESCRDPGFACLRSARGTWGSGVWEFQRHLLFLLLTSTRHSGLPWVQRVFFCALSGMRLGSGQGHSCSNASCLPGSRGQLSEAASQRLLGTRLGSRDGSRLSPPVLAEGHAPSSWPCASVSPADLTLAGRRSSWLSNSNSETKLPITNTLSQGSCPQPVGCGLSHSRGLADGRVRRSKAGFLVHGSACGLACKVLPLPPPLLPRVTFPWRSEFSGSCR